MQSITGQYGTQAGEPAQPVQHSVITANSLGFFLRGVSIPSDLGSDLTTSPAGIKYCGNGRSLRIDFSILPEGPGQSQEIAEGLGVGIAISGRFRIQSVPRRMDWDGSKYQMISPAAGKSALKLT
jgi:hypothetical protein